MPQNEHFFHRITETIPSLFRGIFWNEIPVANPNHMALLYSTVIVIVRLAAITYISKTFKHSTCKECKESVNLRWDVVGDAVRELAVWQKEQKVYRYANF
jgi:hypothetical protein